TGSLLRAPDGSVAGGVITMRDVTAVRQADADLAASEHLFRAAFLDGPTPSVRLADDGVVQAVNAALRRLLGTPSRLVVGRLLADLVHPEDRPQLAALLAAERTPGPVELRLLGLHGGTVWCDVAATRATGRGGEPHVLVQLVDVSARLHREQELEQAARRDPLTGLGNRTHLESLLARAAREQAPVGLLFVDLDGFKAVNDRHGHEAGDAVLVESALRLRAAVRPTDSVVRLGGDEFVVVCPQLSGLGEGELLADRLERLLAAPVDVDGRRVTVGASIGCAVAPVDDPLALLAAADRAMYARKLSRRRGGEERALPVRGHHRGTSAVVAGAIEEGRVALAYQPVVRVATGEVVGTEALLRLTDRAGRHVAPDVAVAVAESDGLIGELGTWVLREALHRTGEWKRLLPAGREFGVGVNLSALQLHEPGLVDLVASALADAAVDPGALVLEVTETRLVPDTLDVRTTLTALRELGVHLAVDDFGTGYASPRYLADFPFDVLKVDRRWTRRLPGTGAAARLARGVFRLAEATGLVVIAEGVEDDTERDAVLAEGCALAQGYRWAAPLPPAVFATLLGLDLPAQRGPADALTPC
ncbi:MAG: putative signaling protein, partial [Frankiales bacterium]|nr:putative signaling protein [Frankiales bacterium]